MRNCTVITSTQFGNGRVKALWLYLRFYTGFCTKRLSFPKEEAKKKKELKSRTG
jgi:hypothetical protein